MDSSMLARLEQLEGDLAALEEEMAQAGTLVDRKRMQELSRRHSEISPIVADFRVYKRNRKEVQELQEALEGDDPDLAELAEEELPNVRETERHLLDCLREHLIPSDAINERDAIVEIRAGTGGEEAGLFVADLFRMYFRFAELRNWRCEILSSSPTDLRGFKEIIFSVEGKGAYGCLKYEGGTHRVQRIPETEASGRIHTSAATVAVFPEAEEVEVQIKPEEIRLDVFRSSGPGGQSVNTTDSAVRLTHLPTGIVVSCQDEKSQHKNRAKALRVLRSRVLEREARLRAAEERDQRRTMVGSGDRSEKIRTYNFPQNRVTDHRIGLSLHRLESVMNGEIRPILEALAARERLDRLEPEKRDQESDGARQAQHGG
ncbi:MAG: peptide chain release factor 1 [bacterium]